MWAKLIEEHEKRIEAIKHTPKPDGPTLISSIDMRLLDTTTIKLSEFHDADIPPYAILSHTWGKNEVSFQDLHRVKSKGPQSYYKIARCCALAALQGYEWVWIDTCCIDKTSSSELSEAINSMYRWYQNSRICYAYLEDVSIDDMETFGSSRWFTRGWTLQELLAPAEVHFYDMRWTKLGSMRSLCEMVAAATDIPPKCLEDRAGVSVAARMSWASKRQTSRVEDLAYSLMGLFDVNMPLLYGEGPKAFMRLQHEIVRNIDDESLFAWTDSSLLVSGIFALSPAAFVDSGDVVARDYPVFYRREPNTVTSRGLSIELFGQVGKDAHSEFDLVPLHCARSADRSMPIVIQVLRYREPNTYARILPGKLGLLGMRDSHVGAELEVESRRVYIKPLYRAVSTFKDGRFYEPEATN